MSDLPFAHGGPPLRGVLRASAEDFEVDEDLGFEPEGHGEHVFVRIEVARKDVPRSREAPLRIVRRFCSRVGEAQPFVVPKDRHRVERKIFWNARA